ncbi:MAG: hypothetical protein ACKOQM_04120 [Novosphingobium sp.]
MSKTKRKAAKSAPISAHPLFPAVVALWLSAAFGLCTLAVGATAIENLVLKSHVDLVIPAAAPPLGITARILLALILAAIGAVLGIALARLLTRPKIEERERKRGAKDLAATSPRVRNRDAHPDAPARRPISAHEEFGDEEPLDMARPSGGLLANRRRSLAISEEEPEFVPHEAAPLPGFDQVAPLDLASLALPVDAPVASDPVYQALAPSPAPSLDWSRPAPAPTPIENAPISAEAAHLAGRQVFGMAPPAAPETAPRQIFGIQAQDDHVPQDFVKAAGFQTSVFDAPEPSPLFERPTEVAATPAAAGEAMSIAPQPLQEAVQPEMAPAAVMPIEAPAAAEPLPSPSSLGMTDLAARLAESMRRRRERAQGAATPAAGVATHEPTAPAPFQAEFQPSASVPLEIPAMPPAFAVPVEPVNEPAPSLAAVVEAAVSAADPLPRFAAPVSEPEAAASAVPLAIPAAMRPLALDAFLEDDAALDNTSFLPPRHIAMPAAPQPSAPFAAPAATPEASAPIEAPVASPVPEQESALEESLADAAEDNPYASLLAVAPVRQGHVRIDEAEPAGAEIEPVVIFPGQSGQVVPLAAPTAQAAEEAGFRRFDAPDSAGQGQPIAGHAAVSQIPPDEAAQALRAALSNLQRMSGAA